MNRTEQMALIRRIEQGEARIKALEDVLLPPETVEPMEPNAQVEGAEVPAEPFDADDQRDALDAATAKTRLPPHQGIEDLQGGWFNAYFDGRKLNTKALRKADAEDLVEQHVGMALAAAEAQAQAAE